MAVLYFLQGCNPYCKYICIGDTLPVFHEWLVLTQWVLSYSPKRHEKDKTLVWKTILLQYHKEKLDCRENMSRRSFQDIIFFFLETYILGSCSNHSSCGKTCHRIKNIMYDQNMSYLQSANRTKGWNKMCNKHVNHLNTIIFQWPSLFSFSLDAWCPNAFLLNVRYWTMQWTWILMVS